MRGHPLCGPAQRNHSMTQGRASRSPHNREVGLIPQDRAARPRETTQPRWLTAPRPAPRPRHARRRSSRSNTSRPPSPVGRERQRARESRALLVHAAQRLRRPFAQQREAVSVAGDAPARSVRSTRDPTAQRPAGRSPAAQLANAAANSATSQRAPRASASSHRSNSAPRQRARSPDAIRWRRATPRRAAREPPGDPNRAPNTAPASKPPRQAPRPTTIRAHRLIRRRPPQTGHPPRTLDTATARHLCPGRPASRRIRRHGDRTTPTICWSRADRRRRAPRRPRVGRSRSAGSCACSPGWRGASARRSCASAAGVMVGRLGMRQPRRLRLHDLPRDPRNARLGRRDDLVSRPPRTLALTALTATVHPHAPRTPHQQPGPARRAAQNVVAAPTGRCDARRPATAPVARHRRPRGLRAPSARVPPCYRPPEVAGISGPTTASTTRAADVRSRVVVPPGDAPALNPGAATRRSRLRPPTPDHPPLASPHTAPSHQSLSSPAAHTSYIPPLPRTPSSPSTPISFPATAPSSAPLRTQYHLTMMILLAWPDAVDWEARGWASSATTSSRSPKATTTTTRAAARRPASGPVAAPRSSAWPGR